MFLDEEFSLAERRSRATQILPCLPGKNPGQWHSLACLGMQSYDASSATCTAVANFTAFSEQDFRAMQAHYTALSKLPAFSTAYLERASLLKETLAHAYAHSMAGQRTYASSQKSLHYPPVWRLRLESLYYQLPLTWLALGFYMLAALFCCVYQREHGRAWSRAVLLCTGLGFLTHSAILALRILILARAPVASMYETLVYVPWITMILGMIWWSRQRDFLALLAALLGSILLLALLSITQLDQGLENVQAVLDSQYWLIIHVLMVVGSYGVFLLSALLAHFHLLQKGCNKQLPPLILRTLYIGSALLITGTVLGGIWAAESWGRFWDWDPKESWAFIASCCYITGIHLYTFRKISDLGLALWAGLSFLVITFTWYGVNYILGTGLHSYGFGSGGEAIYYSFILLDSTLLLAGYLRAKRHINLRRQLAGNL
jgi:ABC-type transport system involved in cytochrome c biogenesis permease subunit